MILQGTNSERCLLGGEALELYYAALKEVSEYKKERVVFQPPVVQNQAIAHPLADTFMRLVAAKLATHHAARLYDQNKTDPLFLAAKATFTACERAVLTHRVMDYAIKYDMERQLRYREMIFNYNSERVLELPWSY
ncbi:hypothetical protein COCMIDRAFT_37270 [Bipolaris oryzae ATCC 44560]|uniref:Acyl-CoA dehydrogenase/oxidase C-terminal domain-containing protein n=1 Tax=Bipolaris oryzae ATCC 44560 TaxID=930090 RepID=W6Z5A3_COCMI|nr:uncharacterized protein COCMIDRAFT_37270 [Bipolaris oryzae ATCC 44560]EUC44938.1 hypothetical protein COCMIDRAFT_37270 [Bipolaris oryzae ATCC 44560]